MKWSWTHKTPKGYAAHRPFLCARCVAVEDAGDCAAAVWALAVRALTGSLMGGHRLLINPVPAHSRIASMPAAAALVSGNDRETPSSEPSGPIILNRTPDASST